MSELGERIRQLHHQHKKLTEEKSGKDITQEFVIRTKRYDLTCALKVTLYWIIKWSWILITSNHV